MTPFERSLSKLSENHEIVEIGSTEFNLWAAERVPEPLIKRRGGGDLGKYQYIHTYTHRHTIIYVLIPFAGAVPLSPYTL